MCGAVYDKAEVAAAREERSRQLGPRDYLTDKRCGCCHKNVSKFTRWCPHCKGPVRGRRLTFASALVSGALSAALVGVMLVNQRAPVSPFPGISDSRFAHCVDISARWSNAHTKLGAGAAETLSAQNEWHASCSRKALRLLREQPGIRLPTTPEGWLVAKID
jgi:hypothetical protein